MYAAAAGATATMIDGTTTGAAGDIEMQRVSVVLSRARRGCEITANAGVILYFLCSPPRRYDDRDRRYDDRDRRDRDRYDDRDRYRDRDRDRY